jgi:hypothetical protein
LTANVVDTFEVDPVTLTPVNAVRPCRPQALAARITVVLARCHPTVDDAGRPPECDELAAAASQLHTDVADMWRALTCCLDRAFRVTSIAPQAGDPSGGCVAVVADLTVALDGVV